MLDDLPSIIDGLDIYSTQDILINTVQGKKIILNGREFNGTGVYSYLGNEADCLITKPVRIYSTDNVVIRTPVGKKVSLNGVNYVSPAGTISPITNKSRLDVTGENIYSTEDIIIETPSNKNIWVNGIGTADLKIARLDTSIGIAHTPDPGLLPTECCFVALVSKNSMAADQNGIIAGQLNSAAGTYIWRMSTFAGALYTQVTPDGKDPFRPSLCASAAQMDTEFDANYPFYIAVVWDGDDDNGSTSAQAYTSGDGGVTWRTFGTKSTVIGATNPFDGTALLRIGAYGDAHNSWIWNGKIYWVELRTGNDPNVNTNRRREITFPGTPGNWLSIPDAANLDIIGDIEIVVRVSQPDWEATSIPSVRGFVSKASDVGGGNYRSFLFRRATGNKLIHFAWSTDGATYGTTANLTYPASFLNNQLIWLRLRFDADNGASGTTTTLSYNLTDTSSEPTTWTDLTPATYAGVSSIFNSTAPVVIGADYSTRYNIGRIARAIIRDGIGGRTVLDVSDESATGKPSITGTTFQSNDTGNRYVRFPAVVGNYLSAPDSTTLDITGDIEIVLRIKPNSWRPASINEIINKYVTVGNQRSYRVNLTTSGIITFYVTVDGINAISGISSALADDNLTKWIKVTRVASTGLISLYWAVDNIAEPSSWTAIGTATPGVGNIFSGSAPLYIGQLNVNGQEAPFNGNIYRVIIRNGIAGPIVFDFDASKDLNGISPTATSFTATTGGTATVNRSGSPQLELITGRSTVTLTQNPADPPVLKEVPDEVIWRFDASEAPVGQTVYTDPRGKTWTLTNAGAIVRP